MLQRRLRRAWHLTQGEPTQVFLELQIRQLSDMGCRQNLRAGADTLPVVGREETTTAALEYKCGVDGVGDITLIASHELAPKSA